MVIDQPFNPEMLILARESRATTQTDLAKRCGTSQGRISKIENGLLEPDGDLLAAISKALDYPPSFFGMRDPVRGLPLSFFRRRKSTAAGVVRRIEAQVNLMAMQVRRLLQAVELEREAIPQLDVDALEGDVEAAAHSVRQLWELPRGPLKNLVESVEDHGGIVLEMPEDISELDGLGMSSSDLPPLFFVDLTKPVDRLRFTLAHELGHVVLHSIPSPDRDTEREADRFAAEFLMPRKDILPDFSDKVTLESLASMKPYWRVSMAALLRRARDLGVIDEGRYRYLNVEMSRRGYKRREPAELDLDPERPSLLRDIIEFHRRELGYSVEEIAKLVNDYPAQVKQRYLQTRSHLRLVG